MSGAAREWAAGSDFLILHRALIRALDGSWSAAGLWQRIQFRAGDGWWAPESQEAMFADAELTEHKGKAALRLLRTKGLIESERVSSFNPALRYRVVWDDESKEETSLTVGVETSRAVRDETSQSRREETSRTSSIRTGRTNNPVAVAPVDEPLPGMGVVRLVPPPDCTEERFAEWWALFPNHAPSRKAAWVKYERAVKAGADPDAILAGLRRWLPVWESGEFVPHATTWLNQSRWEAEPHVRRPAPAAPAFVASGPPDWYGS